MKLSGEGEMSTYSGEGSSNNHDSNNPRKRPMITTRSRSRLYHRRHVEEHLGKIGEDEDRENDAREGIERHNEETEYDTEEVEEDQENAEGEDDANSVGEVASDGGVNRDGSISVILTDPDILDCCICREPLSIPVFQGNLGERKHFDESHRWSECSDLVAMQCLNGHIACSNCCVKSAYRCHSCRARIGHIRCRAIEKVLESVRISCCYARHGCREKISHINKSIHEKDCIFTPCWCPFDGCHFTVPINKLSQHIKHEHRGAFLNFCYDSFLYLALRPNQKVVVLQERTDSTLFILTNDVDHRGNVIKLFHVSPKPSAAEMYRYELYTRSQGCCLKLNSSVNHTLGNDFPATRFLLVPTDFLGPSGFVRIRIRIKCMNPAGASNF